MAAADLRCSDNARQEGTTISPKLEDAKAELIGRAAAIAHERLAGDQATALATFIEQYYAHVAPEDLLELDVYDLYGAAVAHWNLGRDRPQGTTRVRVSVPIIRGRAQTVTARVRFRNGAAPRTLVHRAVRCATAAVAPQFTG